MRLTRRRAAALALVLALSLPYARARGEIIDGVAAIVNDDVITISEVDDAGAPIYREIQRKYGDDAQAEISQARREVLDQLVDQKLMEQVIKKYEISASDTEVDLAIDDVKKQNGISQQALERALEKEGLTFQDYREQVRRQIERTKLVSRQVRNRNNVTDSQTKKYYDEHPDDFKRDEEIRVRHILIAFPPNATPEQKAAAHKKAEEALASLKGGTPFDVLARKVSAGPTAAQGGELGWVRRGDTVPEFEAAAFLLEKGATSEVVETRVGYHVIQVEDKRPPRTLTFAEAKEAIRSKLSQDAIESEFGEWMKKLRDNAYVEKKL